MSDPWAINAGKASTAIGTATIESDDNLLTITDHGLGDGDTVTVDTLTGGGSALTADAVYFIRDVDGNDFALSLTLHGPQVEFATDGGADVYHFAPQYTAAELRRLNAGLMFGGTSDAFGVRQGVRPGHTPLSVSGTTWTVEDLTGAVYPGLSSDDGGYPVAHQSESGSLDPADGANDRIDALDLQIQDDDTDASGFRRARVVYVTGTPAADPDPPTVTTNALRLGTILVPQNGTGSPSIDTLAQWTVASGGVLPVRDDTELPAAGLYDGMTVYNQDTDALIVREGGVWKPLALADPPMIRTFLGSNTSNVPAETVFGSMTVDFGYPSAAVWDSGIHSSVKEIPRDGVYRVTAYARSGTSAAGLRQVTIRKNVASADPTTGTLIGNWLSQPDDDPGVSAGGSMLHQFDAGDNVTVGFIQTSGGSIDLVGGTDDTYFEVEWVRPL